MAVKEIDPFLWLAPELAGDADAYERRASLVKKNLTCYFIHHGCAAEAEDLASESLLRLMRRLGEGHGGELDSAEARSKYLFGIAKYVLYEWQRNPAAKAEALNDREEDAGFTLPPLNLIAKQCQELLREAVHRCMSRLSPAEQEILRQRELHPDAPTTLAELARAMGTQPDAMRQQAHRIRKRFRQWMLAHERIQELLRCLGIQRV